MKREKRAGKAVKKEVKTWIIVLAILLAIISIFVFINTLFGPSKRNIEYGGALKSAGVFSYTTSNDLCTEPLHKVCGSNPNPKDKRSYCCYDESEELCDDRSATPQCYPEVCETGKGMTKCMDICCYKTQRCVISGIPLLPSCNENPACTSSQKTCFGIPGSFYAQSTACCKSSSECSTYLAGQPTCKDSCSFWQKKCDGSGDYVGQRVCCGLFSSCVRSTSGRPYCS